MNFKKTILLWAITLLVTAGGAFAQVKKKTTTTPARKPAATAGKPAAQAGAPASGALPTDPYVTVGKLPNGLTYYIRANSSPKGKAQLILVNKVGSVIETDAQRGLANFVQHLAFSGTRDMSKDEMSGYLTKLGNRFGPDINAFTSYDETIYQIAVPTDTPKVFANGFNLLANWASKITFDPAAVNTEKAALIEKVTTPAKSPQERMQKQTLPLLLNNSRYATRLPIGTEAAIKTFSDASAKSFYADWYRPDLQAVIAIGDFDPKQVEEMIKFSFSSLRNPSPEKPVVPYPAAAVPGTTVKFATEKDLPYALVQVMVKHPQTVIRTQADLMQSLRVNLFNQLLNTRVTDLTKVPAPAIIYGQSSYAEFVGKQDAFTTIGVANNAQGLEAAVKAIFGETERARRYGFTITELERAKQNALAQVTARYQAKDNASSISFVSEYERNFLNKQAIPGIDYEYNYCINNIGKITLAEMNALAARFITDQNRVVLIEAAEADKDKLPTEPTLLKWIADASKAATAYVDDSAEPIMRQPPVAGKVASVKTDSTLLVTTVTFSNGLKAILKPSNFASNQILFAGYSFGGTSLAAPQDMAGVNIIAPVITTSGAGSFTQTQLTKMLRDKNLSVTTYLGDITQGVSGYSSTENFESALQLMYLYFTAPRKDADTWKRYVDQSKAALVKNAGDPGAVYQDTVLAVLNSYNPRAMPTTADQLQAASLDKAFDFYKARFADASNFTFTFTGDFEVNDIVPYLAVYLGSLPSTNSKETFKNWSIHPPAGQITKTVTKGASDKSTVQLIFNGTYDYNDANNLQMDALEEVMNIRLVDSLKEGNGIYSPVVRASYVKVPEGRYKITVSFLADAGTIDRAIAYMLNAITQLKQVGPLASDVNLFVARDAQTTRAQLKQNAYWQAALITASQNQEDPDKMLNRMQNLAGVNAQSVKEAANKYLNTDNLIKAILLPEKK